RTYSVADFCGNIIPIEHRTVVDDNIDPLINCLPDTTVYYDTLVPPAVTTLDDFILQGGTASDNCQLDSTSFTLVSEVPVVVGDNTVITRTYSVADMCGNTATCEQTINLNKPNTPPEAIVDRFRGGCNPISGMLLDNDFDPDGNAISINIVPISQPTYGDLTIMADGSFKYEFIFTEALVDSFIYQICDDHPDSKCDTAIVYITVFADNDCDGIDNAIDIDDDDDGILDVDEGDGEIDSDGDGFPNSLDIDSDNDGIVDNIEAQPEGHFIPLSGIDDNQNGLDDIYEDGNKLGITPVDTDSDGTPDYLDLDTDDDGIPDVIEGFDIGAKGIAQIEPTNYDVDRDGLDDGYDSYSGRINLADIDNPFGSRATLEDFDGDGWRDWRDVDDDGDGIKTKYEDLDNNGIYFDDDLDYDGHPEYLDKRADCELFIPEGFSPNNDGVHDFFQIYCIEKYPNAKLLIFDRWGNKLYEHENYGNQDFWGNYDESWWDGTTTRNPNKKVDPGNYLYILETSTGSSERGFVMVSY
ncbi:T9SS type B sorting domain-containing protein, partial [Sunxiuqinia sp. A32]|uniref:T9SS type B sorting domain-containing protein n=1 Tax=Sunxiuqinia sp. A32 TaxID=3461496 RepID=UPI004045923B